ncbi:hypothetical protein BT96DRAFT_1013162 [Gymnopus androsaceus JB14]|uniref:SUI1 domain-containing protein n=1 Tax=Gymnopus androsaceus JB14 TaxID=1447944 RepID=A0A6A4IGD0_9AGAR|nr:hypothetical protein BT96DRAFT_1013162 [Gymnopus androsaceus JB14]
MTVDCKGVAGDYGIASPQATAKSNVEPALKVNGSYYYIIKRWFTHDNRIADYKRQIKGADLMRGGVIHCSDLSLAEGQFVSICRYEHTTEGGMLSPPLAGKAVFVLHAWKDHLWDMGSKGEVPMSVKVATGAEEEGEEPAAAEPTESLDNDAPPTNSYVYTPTEISHFLRLSLLQAISTTLSSISLPTSTFPIPATTFYTTYILPNRPYFPEKLVSVSPPGNSSTPTPTPDPDPYTITLKSSSHKSLSAFLKSAEKSSLITTKSPPKKHSAQTDILITSVNATRPDVQAHALYATVGEVEAKAARKALREEKAEGPARSEMEVRELWKPHLSSVALFEGMGASSSTLYTLPEIRSLLNEYITKHAERLVNPNDQVYINVHVDTDPLLASCVSSNSKGKGKSKDKANDKGKDKGKSSGKEEQPEIEFIKRDELLKRVSDKMQRWYEVKGAGDTDSDEAGKLKKGTISPIQIVIKIRQGRKASTLISGFELFGIDTEDMKEELRKGVGVGVSVSPLPGAGSNSGSQSQVLVQGKQAKAVLGYLVGKMGVPSKWVEVKDLSGGKK